MLICAAVAVISLSGVAMLRVNHETHHAHDDKGQRNSVDDGGDGLLRIGVDTLVAVLQECSSSSSIAATILRISSIACLP